MDHSHINNNDCNDNDNEPKHTKVDGIDFYLITDWSTTTKMNYIYVTIDRGTFVIERYDKDSKELVQTRIVKRQKLRSSLINDGLELDFINDILEF